MSRPILLSNGEMHVGLDEIGQVHDFYYPYVGGENHTAAPELQHRIGVWIDGSFSWLNDGSWSISHSYLPQTLIGIVTASNESLGIMLEMTDTIDSEQSVFIRNIHVINLRDIARDVRLFMHQVFVISNSYASDTVQYLPDENAVVHYKGLRTFVVSGHTQDKRPFDQHAVGLHGIEGREGSYKDAEDGELSGNNVEHGRVDSTIRFSMALAAHDSARAHYWIAAGKSQREALLIHKRLQSEGALHRLLVTNAYWREWIVPARKVADKLDPAYRESFIQSILLMKAHIDKRGAVIASTDTTMLNYSRDSYAYCWPRDGAHVLWPLVRLGYVDEPLHYFMFCRRVLSSKGSLMHKYQPDGALGSSWHPYIERGAMTAQPIQEDETAIVLFVFAQYYAMHKDEKLLKEFYPTFVEPMANFLAGFIDEEGLPHPSYDLWERLFLTSTYTVAVTFAALNEAAHLAEEMKDDEAAVRWRTAAENIQIAARKYLYDSERQSFVKGVRRELDGSLYIDKTIDASSVYGAYMFGLFDVYGEEVKTSFEMVKQQLKTSDAHPALARFENDEYDRFDPSRVGNPWFVSTLWYAQYMLELGEESTAQSYIEWVQGQMTSTGTLPEQFDPDTLAPISVSPLAWSQAEYVNCLLDTIKTNGAI